MLFVWLLFIIFLVNKVSGEVGGEAAHELLLPFVKIGVGPWDVTDG
jgi:hypothetical protein